MAYKTYGTYKKIKKRHISYRFYTLIPFRVHIVPQMQGLQRARVHSLQGVNEKSEPEGNAADAVQDALEGYLPTINIVGFLCISGFAALRHSAMGRVRITCVGEVISTATVNRTAGASVARKSANSLSLR